MLLFAPVELKTTSPPILDILDFRLAIFKKLLNYDLKTEIKAEKEKFQSYKS